MAEPVQRDKFTVLQNKFEKMKLIANQEKELNERQTMVERFEIQMKNLESNIYNSKLYNGSFPMKEVPLDAKYEVVSELEEYVYCEYLRDKYPYSSVSVEKLGETRRMIKIILLDEDRGTFLNKYNIITEERQIPETYFVKLK